MTLSGFGDIYLEYKFSFFKKKSIVNELRTNGSGAPRPGNATPMMMMMMIALLRALLCGWQAKWAE